MTWRGTKENSSAAGQQSTSSPTAISAPSQAETALPPTATPGISSENNASPSAMTSPNQRAPTPRENQAASPQPASPIVSVAASRSISAAEPTGAEDLATAENYLNGTHGASRDRKVAAQWLWKAVGKGNLTAATVLSDLYLRGDGVSKSCDQARLLLDAAARKGSRAAAERLTNLQAFGCQ
jgi:TPR repeat protein